MRSINRIASQSSHRYSRGGTTPLCYTSKDASFLNACVCVCVCVWGGGGACVCVCGGGGA